MTERGQADDAPASSRHRAPRRKLSIALRVLAGLLVVVVVWAGVTFQRTWAASDGEPMSVVVATWMRDNRMGPLVAQLEDIYYRYVDTPDVGGTPALSADITAEDSAGLDGGDDTDADVTPPTESDSESVPALLDPANRPPAPSPAAGPPAAGRPHLDPPATLDSPVKSPEPKEGVWQPVASRVDGIPAVYVTRVRADDVHTSYYASVMWIDTLLTRAMFIPGYQEPGGPNPYDGALPKEYWPDVLANVNGAFRLDDSRGGYYYRGKTIRALVKGRASAVVYKDGSIEIGKWGRDLGMTPDVEVVRQNLDLIVDKGTSKVSSATDNIVWGATTDKESLAWRAALGQRADGSIVYVGSPYLSAESLADVLVKSGVQRAMVLDMNNWWTAGFYFRHKKDGTPLCRKLDPSIQENCDRFLKPYKRDSFQFLADRSYVPAPIPAPIPAAGAPADQAGVPSPTPSPVP